MKIDDKILVTGAKGLVGSALVEHMKSAGYENIIELGRQECDLVRADSTLEFFEKHRPDYIFHAAARVYGIMGNMKNKALSFYDNVMINTNVVDAAQKVGVKKITVMGTGAVYPYPSPGLPLKEDMIFSGSRTLLRTPMLMQSEPCWQCFAHMRKATEWSGPTLFLAIYLVLETSSILSLVMSFLRSSRNSMTQSRVGVM